MKPLRWVTLFLLIGVMLFIPLRAAQYVSALCIAVLLFSLLYSRITMGAVRVKRRDQTLRAHRFEPLPIVLTVENRSILPLPCVTLVDAHGPLYTPDSAKFVFPLRPRETRTFSYTIESQARGEYTVGPVEVFGADPLGFFPWKQKLGGTGRLISYPEVLSMEARVSSGVPAGSIRAASRIYEDITRYRSIREYVPGDDLRRISWKTSAKTGRLHSMEYLPTLFSPVMILVNMAREDFPLRYRSHWIERTAAAAASLVMYFVSLKQDVGLIASASIGNQIPAARMGSGTDHATAILELLARMQPAESPGDYTRLLAVSGLDIPAGTRVEVVTPRVTADQRAALRESTSKGRIVELFLMGGEEFEGRDQLSLEFPVFVVSEYGSELVTR